MSAFTSALHNISEKCIPKSSTRSKRRNLWYNDERKTAINKRKSALRKFNKNLSRENHMHSKLARAKARRTIKDAKRSSWRQYVNKLNSRTPVKKVWDMIRKVRAPCHPGGRNRWLLCACSRWVRPPLYNATVRYTVPSNSLKQQKSIIRSLFFHTYRSNV